MQLFNLYIYIYVCIDFNFLTKKKDILQVSFQSFCINMTVSSDKNDKQIIKKNLFFFFLTID